MFYVAGLATANPGCTFVCGIIKVTVGSGRQKLPSGVLKGGKGLGILASILGYPGCAFVRGIINTLVGKGYQFSAVGNEVTECSAAASGVAGNPAGSTIG